MSNSLEINNHKYANCIVCKTKFPFTLLGIVIDIFLNFNKQFLLFFCSNECKDYYYGLVIKRYVH